MSRWKFMRQLEELLSDISPNEREEALNIIMIILMMQEGKMSRK